MSYIERAITDILKDRVSSSKCLLLTGARQIGKSTISKNVFPDYNIANFDNLLVGPPYAGSNPVSHLLHIFCNIKRYPFFRKW